MIEIIQKDNPLLRQKAKEVAAEDIQSRKIESVIRRMKEALQGEDDGVAIAAPQIGESLRIFVVSKKIFDIMDEEKKQKKPKHQKNDEFEESERPTKREDMVFINPEIIKVSKKKIELEEGCLSVRWLYGKVKRNEKTLVKALDENGRSFSMGGSGLLSQVFQHEIDHLNGILFIDTARDVKDIPPDNK